MSPITITRQVFGTRWKSAWCIAFYESRRTLNPSPYGPNYGPWQINGAAHPWANRYLLTHSWRYSARVAFRISSGGRNWAPWSTRSSCGV